MKRIGLIMAGLVIIAMAACTSTKVTSSWRANDAQKLQKDNRIMVMALVPQRDRTLRGQMENYTVAELRKRGYNATSALQAYGPQDMGKLSEKQVVRQMQGSNVNQVMTIVMLDKGRERNFVPDYGPYGFGFWPYYSMWYSRMYSPGYYTYNTKYQWEGNLYDLKSGQLLYSVQSNSFDPPTTERMAVLYGQQVVKDMVKQQIINQ